MVPHFSHALLQVLFALRSHHSQVVGSWSSALSTKVSVLPLPGLRQPFDRQRPAELPLSASGVACCARADNNTRFDSEQWMMGDALLVSPILYPGQMTARAYFPQGIWYDFYSGKAVDASANGTWGQVQVRASPRPPPAAGALLAWALPPGSRRPSGAACKLGSLHRRRRRSQPPAPMAMHGLRESRPLTETQTVV